MFNSTRAKKAKHIIPTYLIINVAFYSIILLSTQNRTKILYMQNVTKKSVSNDATEIKVPDAGARRWRGRKGRKLPDSKPQRTLSQEFCTSL